MILFSAVSAEDTSQIASVSGASESEELQKAPRSRLRKALSASGWVGFAFLCLIVFTWAKLPDEKIKNYITQMIGSTLSDRGIIFNAEEANLSFLFGPSLILKKVTLNLPPPAQPVHLDRVDVAPSIFSLLIGRLGGQFSIYQGNGKVSGAVSVNKTALSAKLKASSFDIGKAGFIHILTGIQASGLLDGTVSLSGDLEQPSSIDAETQLQLSQGAIEAQSIYGFSIPRIGISEMVVSGIAEKGKASIKTFRIGKVEKFAGDDLRGVITGDITLGKTWPQSTVSLKTHFSVSETITRTFVLLDAILGAGKQPDGAYGFLLTGPINGINPIPLPPGES